MRAFIIGKNDAGQRLDRFLAKAVPLLPASLAQKYVRIKRIKVNGARAERDRRLNEGDRVECWINDEFFDAPDESNVYLTITKPRVNIVYEDENVVLLDKPAGMLCHAGDEGGGGATQLDHLLAHLYQTRAWRPREENAFTPALCNRIDRNTGGLIIAAKNAEALRILNEKIRAREISKHYLCVCLGRPAPAHGRIECVLRKDARENRMRVYHHAVPDGRSAVTLYDTLETRDGLSLVEVELLTGRTHQIRASFADIGCPLLGDGKYGSGAANRKYGETAQLLCSYRLRFDFPTDAGLLNDLRGREFAADTPAFRHKYFP
ncbi:MAG: RluA family pseudouridine synthase [Oscillospiraceae bacterium]|nr:RluA family pseudouridine synthase [Oscillospiraceae bacterium]